ncbi:MAG: Rv2175c family DNA-binding protein [Nocardioidaceae bacterium]|nr:Rv2175c family DNA-binding protein [Nocardioidaceae bacterium]
MTSAETPESTPGAVLDDLVPSWLSLEEAAERLGTSPNRIRQWAAERQLIAVRTPASRAPRVPAECLVDAAVVKGLAGLLTLLLDAGFDDLEAAVWIFTPDDTLPGRPVDALREDRGREVRRRAQALAF